ncbi:MAG: hypothetical protein IPN68_15920 [Bacteroidetes bacterium]|nr:hypothetical protein [Bacteroidota bacterium]
MNCQTSYEEEDETVYDIFRYTKVYGDVARLVEVIRTYPLEGYDHSEIAQILESLNLLKITVLEGKG